MSEHRNPVEIWKRVLPDNQGNKLANICALKIELFPSRYWSDRWEPGSRLFTPKIPLRTVDRREYHDTRFRVRVNGVWKQGKEAKYRMLTREQIARIYGFI